MIYPIFTIFCFTNLNWPEAVQPWKLYAVKIKCNIACEWVQKKAIAKLDRLYLLQEHYGKKLGYQLMDFNLQLARRENQEGIWLYTWIENHRAISFYQKFGFEIVGEADFKISENHVNPNHIMFLDFARNGMHL